jgi:hypothetical protein
VNSDADWDLNMAWTLTQLHGQSLEKEMSDGKQWEKNNRGVVEGIIGWEVSKYNNSYKMI